MSRTRTTALFTLVLLAAAMVAGGGVQQKEGVDTPPLVQWCGPESKRPDAGMILVRDAAAWEAVWAAHTGEKLGEGAMFRNVCPKVDFTRCCIVARFVGPAVNCDGEIAESVRDAGDRLVIRFETSSFQTFGTDGRGGAVDVHPFGIWVVPNTDKPIAVEQATRANGLKADPITWKEVHRFPARMLHIPPPAGKS